MSKTKEGQGRTAIGPLSTFGEISWNLKTEAAGEGGRESNILRNARDK